MALVGVAVAKYDCMERYGELPKCEEGLRALAKTLAGHTFLIVNPSVSDLTFRLVDALPKGGYKGRALLVVWSGHGVAVKGTHLRLVVRNTAEPTLTETYQPAALGELAANTGADQILVVLDTCHAAAGILPTLEAVQSVTEAAMKAEEVWVGVLATSQSYGRARDGELLSQLTELVLNGPRTAEERSTVWGPYNRFIRGDEFLHTLAAEWPMADPKQTLQPATIGKARNFIPNPCWAESAPEEVVAHLLLAARGADPGEEAWYFSGRESAMRTIVRRIRNRPPGLFVVTGPAGSGKSAILGRIASLSNEVERSKIRSWSGIPEESGDPGASAVNANLNLRNLTSEEVVYRLGRQLRRPDARTIWALMDCAAKESRVPVVLLDGLDECGTEARRLAGDIVQLSQVACVIVSTRRFEAGFHGSSTARSLPHLLAGPSSTILDLAGEDKHALMKDLKLYAEKRLVAMAGEDARPALTDAVARLALDDAEGGSFLLARVLTSRIRDEPTIDPRSLHTSLEEAFEADVRRWPELERDGQVVVGGARDLLFALAFAVGDGLPARDVWPVVASAVSTNGTSFTNEDVRNLLGRHSGAYGRYIVAASEGGEAVYRLYHRRLVEHLRGSSAIGDERAVSVYRALEQLACHQAALRP